MAGTNSRGEILGRSKHRSTTAPERNDKRHKTKANTEKTEPHYETGVQTNDIHRNTKRGMVP